MNPNNEINWSNKGLALNNLGKYDEVIDWWDFLFRLIIILVVIKQLNWIQRMLLLGITKDRHWIVNVNTKKR